MKRKTYAEKLEYLLNREDIKADKELYEILSAYQKTINSRSKYSRTAERRAAAKLYQNKLRRDNIEKFNAYHREYRAKHAEEYRAYQKAYRQKRKVSK